MKTFLPILTIMVPLIGQDYCHVKARFVIGGVKLRSEAVVFALRHDNLEQPRLTVLLIVKQQLLFFPALAFAKQSSSELTGSTSVLKSGQNQHRCLRPYIAFKKMIALYILFVPEWNWAISHIPTAIFSKYLKVTQGKSQKMTHTLRRTTLRNYNRIVCASSSFVILLEDTL